MNICRKILVVVAVIVVISGYLTCYPKAVLAEEGASFYSNLEADNLTYNEETKKMEADGNIKYTDKNITISATSLNYDTEHKIVKLFDKIVVVIENEQDTTADHEKADSKKNTSKLQADNLVYDEQTQCMVATGNVTYTDNNYVMSATNMQYDKGRGLLQATGNVVTNITKFDKEGHSAILQSNTISYEKGKGQVKATGAIVLKFNSNTMQGEYLNYNQRSKQLELMKKVVLQDKEDETIAGDRLVYDVDRKEGQVENFTGSFKNEEIIYFIKGKQVTFSDDRIIAKESQLTTCEEPEPHYHFYAQQIEYYPKKEIILYKSSYWQGKTKLFEVNKKVLPLYHDDLNLPEVGYSQDEGFYVKTKSFYDLGNKDYGIAYQDWMSQRGLGIGFKEFRFGDNDKKAEYSLYAAQYPGAENQILRGDWQLNKPGQQQMLSVERENNEWENQGKLLQGNWSFLGNIGAVQTGATVQLESRTGFDDYSVINEQLNQSVQNSKNVRTLFNYNYSSSIYQGIPTSSANNYSLQTEYTAPLYTANAIFLQKTGNLIYTPKLTIQSTLPSSYQFAVDTMHVSATDSNLSVQQSDVTANYRSKTQKLGNDTFFMTSGNATETSFSDGNTNNNWLVNSSILKNINEKFYIDTQLTVSQARGFNSLSSSAVDQDQRLATFETNYIFDENYRINTSLAYDFILHQYQLAQVNLNGRTYPFWNWNVILQYDLAQHQWATNGLMITLNPDSNLVGYVRFDYNVQTAAMQDASIRLEGKLSHNWIYSINTDYYLGQVNISEVKFVRDLDCQKLTIGYNSQQKEVIANIELKNL